MSTKAARRVLLASLLVTLLVHGVTWPARAAAPANQPDAASTLQAEMAHQLQSEKLNGAVWSLVTPGAGILSGAAGVKHAGTGQAMTPTTRVHVGSVAKTVLAIGVLRLISTGKLSLETELTTLLPALQLNNP